MVRVIVALLVLGLGAIGWVLLLPDAARKPQPVADATALAPAAAPAADAAPPAPARTPREVRVVYAGANAGAPVRKLTDKVDDATSAPAAPAAPAVSPTVAADQSPVTAVAAASPPPPAPVAAPPAAPVPAPDAPAGSAVNINTASVEALNQIPGAGRIGRTIASHRPYASIDELLSKRVIRKSIYDKIKDQIAAN